MSEDIKSVEIQQGSKEESKGKENYWIKTIPVLPRSLAVMLLLCNIFFPSSGTFFMACIGDKLRKTQFLIAVFQLITTFLIVGYVWSIVWGVYVVMKSYVHEQKDLSKHCQLNNISK